MCYFYETISKRKLCPIFKSSFIFNGEKNINLFEEQNVFVSSKINR